MHPQNLYRYTAYGLGIESPLVLPALPGIESAPDVVIRLEQIHFPHKLNDSFAIHATSDGIDLAWEEVGKFRVRAGREILVDPAPGVTDDVLRLFLMGTTLALLLHQRGLMVLHASAVAINGAAVVFVGNKGYGKSTTAASLVARGHHLVADDIVAIDLRDPTAPRVIPGYPMFKLWPESVESLGLAADTLPRLRADADKLGWDAQAHFEAAPLPLRCIYSLAGAQQLHIHPLASQDIFLEILRYLYVSRFPDEFSDPQTSARNFRDTALIARSVPVRLLLRPQDLTCLDDMAQLIERDLETVSPSAPSLPRP